MGFSKMLHRIWSNSALQLQPFCPAVNASAFLHSCKGREYSQLTFCHSRVGSESLVGLHQDTHHGTLVHQGAQHGTFKTNMVLWRTKAHTSKGVYAMHGVTPLCYMKGLPLLPEEAKRACFLIPGPQLHEIDSSNPNEQDSNSHDLAKTLRIQTSRNSSCSSLSISNSYSVAEAGL